MIPIIRSPRNPIFKPNPANAWEAEGAYNGCPVRRGGKIYLLYRALSSPHYHSEAGTQLQVSDIGIAESTDGVRFTKRERFILPEEPWERFGCEDPRVSAFEGLYYIFYTALSDYPFSPKGIRIGMAISDNLKTIREKHLVTPFNAKAMALFPDRVKGKMCAILTAHTDTPPPAMALAYFDKPEDMWSEKYWEKWEKNLGEYTLPLLRNPEDHIELGAPPVKTKYGWLVFYSYIRNYQSPQKIFTIEVVLLSLNDPPTILSRTHMPIMVPQEEYERYGVVPNVIFPSGALLLGDKLSLYYGAADTTCCLATASLKETVRVMRESEELQQISFMRFAENPLIAPDREYPWKAKAVFNPAAILLGGRVHVVYRAMSNDNTSVFGYASSKDGIHFDERLPEPIYVPRESFEEKRVPNGNSGCEDPRITKIGDMLYMCYTAFNGAEPPRVALTSIPVAKFLAKQWEWKKPVLISPPSFDDKDACIFPEKVKGQYLIFHRMGDDIDITLTSTLDFDGKTWLEEQKWLGRRRGFWDGRKVGISSPPLKTKKGWVLLYHGVSEASGVYRVGAVLLNLKDPTRIIGRTDFPVFEPVEKYELEGQVKNVVFPCGAVIMGKKIFIYYGGGDSVVGGASIEVTKLLKAIG